MTYCNLIFSNVDEIVLSVDKVAKVVSVESENEIIVAVITKPIYSKTELDKVMNNIKFTLEVTTGKKIFLTRNMEVFCDIENLKNGEKNVSFETIKSKVEL